MGAYSAALSLSAAACSALRRCRLALRLHLALFALDKQFCLIQLRVFQRLREVFHTVFPLADTLDCTFPRAEAEVNKFAADHLAFARQVPLVYSLCDLSLLAMYKITL